MTFLVDAADYFEAFVSSAEQATEMIYIAGWEIDSRTRLLRQHEQEDGYYQLGKFLDSLAAKTPRLRIYILCWDFSLVFAMEREWFPLFTLNWRTHSHIKFRLDSSHPISASQHQKFVVMDDSVAFCGGIDLTSERWDTSEHRKDNPYRKSPNGRMYPPFHDVQAVVEGQAAAACGQLFRDRWFWATGQELEAPERNEKAPWPRDLEPNLIKPQVAIARTLPPFQEREEVKEVETLYIDTMAAAKNYIYVENQYLTSNTISHSISQALQKKDGPEVIMVLPHESGGWLEQATMDGIRAKVLHQLFEADRYGRLRVLYPCLEHDEPLYVHAKVMIVDDCLVRVGSSNLTNRSMGLDSECDLVVETNEGTQISKGIARFRDRLLAQHLGVSSEEVGQLVSGKESLIQALEALRSGERTLKSFSMTELEHEKIAWIEDTSLVDPEKVIEIDLFLAQFARDEEVERKHRNWIGRVVMLGGLLGLAAAWRWTSLSELISMENLSAWGQMLKEYRLFPVGIIGAYVVGGLLMVPVTLLIGATAMIFAPHVALIYAIIGCLSSAAVTYAVGVRLGRDLVRRLSGKRLNRLSKRLAKRGILTVAIIRNLPVAPFTIVNMVAGASRIRFLDYIAGTAIGMAPGILLLTFFADRLVRAVKNPEWHNIAITVVLGVLLAAGIRLASKKLSKKTGPEDN